MKNIAIKLTTTLRPQRWPLGVCCGLMLFGFVSTAWADSEPNTALPPPTSPVPSFGSPVTQAPPPPEEPVASLAVTPLVNVITKPDFGPFMADLRQKLKVHWQPALQSRKGQANKRTKVIFRVDRQGQLVNPQILESSNDPSFDAAAMASVAQSAPFMPLPDGFNGPYTEIKYTFESSFDTPAIGPSGPQGD
jgi:TonB family protein